MGRELEQRQSKWKWGDKLKPVLDWVSGACVLGAGMLQRVHEIGAFFCGVLLLHTTWYSIYSSVS